ncbi:Multidrug efflux pump subunit AcrB [Hathewaya proteolytica DSM 3090]|uniref:Multidrug efflux pump subunit AcrB n=1 Tax=Hathewaya proteolytica DSM 3090 TaxID=1121331 RepID=A0A1M6MG99_9CLOT|nr:efflux RND transporter permease subunit [Hathewaya proteolytica]SHJ82353.1 Multidrug efflux pump subunit AcrB [Hathewaya proteolytica DSM 3090]
MIKSSVKKPFTVFVATILIIILGFISFQSMTTDLLPKIDLPYVVVITAYPGASPEKVEAAVTKPLESALATTAGIEKISSTSNENSSNIVLQFTQGINMDSVMLDLSSKLDLVKGKLDDEVATPMIVKVNPNMIPIMVASVDVDGLNEKDVSKLVKKDIIPSFERISGVASVDSMGLLDEEVRITLHGDKIDKLNDRVLKSINSKLAETKNKLDEGKKKLQEGRALLEKQSLSKNEELINGTINLDKGKEQIKEAIKNIPQLQKELESQRKDLQSKKDALMWALEEQSKNNIPLTEEQKLSLTQLDDGIRTVDEALANMNGEKTVLEEKLQGLIQTQKNLEMGRSTLNSELSKARMELITKESELDKALKEFEKSRDEAYKKANIGSAITKESLSKILMAQNFSMPAGSIEEDNIQYTVKVGDKFNNMEELKDLVLMHIDVDNVGDIKIQDIGSIDIHDNSEDNYVKVNKNNAVLLSFQKQSNYSTSQVSKSINENMEKLMKNNSKLHIIPLQDQGIYIDVVINSVIDNLVMGGVLAIIVLLLFLKSMKPTIIIALSIPISLMFALVMMYFSGVTLNLISLSGLALGVGMLVDNSIVVIENIYRLRSSGVSAAKAAVQGTTQVAGAILSSTLTTISVFLPIIFTKGLSRQLFTDMGLTIAYSLIASLIVAVTLVPTMASITLKNVTEKKGRIFEKFVQGYEKILRKSLKHKIITLTTVFVLFASSTVLCVAKGAVLMPEMDSNQISISLKVPKGTDDKTARATAEKIVDKISVVEDIETIGVMEQNGSGMMMMGGGDSKSISFYVILKEDKKLSSQEVGSIITNMTKDIPGKIKVSTSNMDMSALGDTGLTVNIKGPDFQVLKNISGDISDIMGKIQGAYDISDGLDEGAKETHIIVDKNKAIAHNLTVAQVYQEIATLLKEEQKSTTLNIGTNEYPIVLVNAQVEGLSREKLKQHIIVVNKNGVEEKVKLSDIASIEENSSLVSIKRNEQMRTMSVKAMVKEGYNVGNVSKDLEKKISSYNVPEGYSVSLGGEKESMDSAFGDLIKMIALAIVFIYMIMVAQFQSLLSPFIVLFTIPLAFTGGFLALIITGVKLSMISILGFLILSGIVVNNGIVFVDYVNQLRLEGMEKGAAIIETGRTRIKPILMTALTTILGLFTMALGIGMGSEMVQPMAIVTIGGLLYATLLTLLVVPVIYDLLNRKELKKLDID